MADTTNEQAQAASAGHQLGQLVGDWLEDHFTSPLLQRAATVLRLYLDHRRQGRACRGDKVLWRDEDGNSVAYDFVMELDGTNERLGVPVAFSETFWRRGSRHSKDKARDDSGKLMPMKDTYPTAQFAGIVAGGDFTKPAVQLVKSRGIDLLLIPKGKVVAAFAKHAVQIDYPDKLPEPQKAQLVAAFRAKVNDAVKAQVADELRAMIGEASLDSYVDRIKGALGALPQEIRIAARRTAVPASFESIEDASAFLQDPHFDFGTATDDYLYEITFADGREFERSVPTLADLRFLHAQTERLGEHVASLTRHI